MKEFKKGTYMTNYTFKVIQWTGGNLQEVRDFLDDDIYEIDKTDDTIFITNIISNDAHKIRCDKGECILIRSDGFIIIERCEEIEEHLINIQPPCFDSKGCKVIVENSPSWEAGDTVTAYENVDFITIPKKDASAILSWIVNYEKIRYHIGGNFKNLSEHFLGSCNDDFGIAFERLIDRISGLIYKEGGRHINYELLKDWKGHQPIELTPENIALFLGDNNHTVR